MRNVVFGANAGGRAVSAALRRSADAASDASPWQSIPGFTAGCHC